MRLPPLSCIIFALVLVDLTLFTLPVKASQLLLEEKVVNTAIRLYRYINTSTNEDGTKKFRYPNPGEDLSTPSCWWEMRPVEHNECRIETLIMKQGINPSVALNDLLNKGAVIDCSIAIEIVKQSISLKLIGKDFFNYAMKRGSTFALPCEFVIGSEGLLTESVIPKMSGVYGYIPNIPSYREINPAGFASGQNVFCVNINDELRYLGFGDIFITPPTEQEISDKLYRDTIEPANETDLKIRAKQNEYKFNRSLWETERLNQLEKHPVRRFSHSVVKGLKKQFSDYLHAKANAP